MKMACLVSFIVIIFTALIIEGQASALGEIGLNTPNPERLYQLQQELAELIPVFDFKDGVRYLYTKGDNGLEELVGEWQLEGRVVITPKHLALFEQKVLIKASTEEAPFCEINLEDCSHNNFQGNAMHWIKNKDRCLCSHTPGSSTYILIIHQRARLSQSEAFIQATIPPSKTCSLNKYINIGKLITVYEPIKVTYQVNDGPAKQMIPLQYLSVQDKQFIELKICSNLIATDLMVTLDEQTISSWSRCVVVAKKYVFDKDDMFKAVLKIQETAGCKRSQEFTIYINESVKSEVEKTAADACKASSQEGETGPTITEVRRECIKSTSSYLPTELPAGVCAKGQETCARPSVTFSTGHEILCDTETDGGGWIIIQRRITSEIDFQRNWEAYEDGFGELRTNFWIGLQNIHRLCNKVTCELRVEVEYGRKSYYASYSTFKVSGQLDQYRLTVGGYSGTAGDSLTYHNNMQFSTKDRDNDLQGDLHGCTTNYHRGGWWFNACASSALNGVWGMANKKGLHWSNTRSSNSMTSSEMKVRQLRPS